MFSGEDEKTALEHIFRFTIQCSEYSNNGNGKLRLFPNSLTGQAFTWYATLPANSINHGRKWKKNPSPILLDQT